MSNVDKKFDRSEALRTSIELISKKWHPQIIYKLQSRPVRFSALEDDLNGISSKVLSSSLSDLQEKGLVDKQGEGYCLTSKGAEMKQALDSVADWGEKFSDSGGDRVLVVEDEDSQREMYTRWLDHYAVESTQEEEEIYDLVDEGMDVVLLDRVLQDFKGDEIAENLKEAYPELQIVMVTAVDPEIDILDLEIDDYLVKPVRRKQVHEAVDRALNRMDKTSKKRELLSLASKKTVLDRSFAAEDQERYEDVKERIEELRTEIDSEELSLGC